MHTIRIILLTIALLLGLFDAGFCGANWGSGGVSLEAPGPIGEKTPDTGKFTEIEIPFVDGEAGVSYPQANTSHPSVQYGTHPYNGSMWKTEAGVHSPIGGTTTEDTDPDFLDMANGQGVVSKASGDLFYRANDGSGLFTIAGTFEAIPTFSSGAVASVGNQLALTFSEAVTKGTG